MPVLMPFDVVPLLPRGLFGYMDDQDGPGGLLGMLDAGAGTAHAGSGLVEDERGDGMVERHRAQDLLMQALIARSALFEGVRRGGVDVLGRILTNPIGIRPPTYDPVTRTPNISNYLADVGRVFSANMPLPGLPGGRPPTASAPATGSAASSFLFRAPARLPSIDKDVSQPALSRGDDPEGERGRSSEQEALIEALKSGGRDVAFGELSKKKFDAINALREANGLSPLTSRQLTVPSNVVRKWSEGRILNEGMSADEVADVLYSAVHNTRSRTLPTRYDHIQALVRPGPETSNVAFIGQSSRDPNAVIKTTYPLQTKRVKRLTKREKEE